MSPIEILHKFEIFDHPGHANYEFGKIKKFESQIWVTLEILLKFKIFDHPGLQSMIFGKIKKFESCRKFC